jgi:uncharacterized membrane protein
MTSYDAATFLADGRHMIANLAGVMPVLMIATAVFGLVAVIVLFSRGAWAAGWLALAGLVLLVGVFEVTLAFEVPIDNQINSWTLSTLPTDWMDTRARWADFHTLRTMLSLAGLATVVAAALFIGSARRGESPQPASATHPKGRTTT